MGRCVISPGIWATLSLGKLAIALLSFPEGFKSLLADRGNLQISLQLADVL